ncbi:hypothetical protein AAFF_G00203380 [Aldrovandia affinis]|uniref:Uncharacterized protein n=1 Tax=Aldrovandia affinis TaxID=143900 RepID=A0AAD7SX13_9TELE|nr:hypothetical protein AAFF_G00203380 [Aldrovandia affinis]
MTWKAELLPFPLLDFVIEAMTKREVGGVAISEAEKKFLLPGGRGERDDGSYRVSLDAEGEIEAAVEAYVSGGEQRNMSAAQRLLKLIKAKIEEKAFVQRKENCSEKRGKCLGLL